MKAVLAPAGTRGDFQPQLALAVELKRRGHDVVLASSPPFGAECEARGIRFVPLGLDIQAWMDEHGKDVGKHLRKALAAFNRVLQEQVTVQFRELHTLTAGADLLVGAGLQFGGASVAAARGIPYRYVAYAPTVLPSAAHPPPVIPLLHYPAFLNRPTWWAFDKFYNRLILRAVNAERATLGLAPVRSFWRSAVTDVPLLAFDSELAPLPRDAPVGAVATGAWHLRDPAPLPAALAEFMGRGDPPVCFGLGSMTDADASGTTADVVLAARAAGRRLVLLGGWARYGQGVSGDDVFVVDQVAHLSLYPHVLLAIHHGGAGAVAAAARCGVPQMAVPHLGDQFQWANAVHRAGLGPAPVPRRALGVARLQEALRWLTEHPQAHAAAAQLGAHLRTRDGVRNAGDELERVVGGGADPAGTRAG